MQYYEACIFVQICRNKLPAFPCIWMKIKNDKLLTTQNYGKRLLQQVLQKTVNRETFPTFVPSYFSLIFSHLPTFFMKRAPMHRSSFGGLKLDSMQTFVKYVRGFKRIRSCCIIFLDFLSINAILSTITKCCRFILYYKGALQTKLYLTIKNELQRKVITISVSFIMMKFFCRSS